MAENRRGVRKPRIRKSAPTVRERVEAASAEREEKPPSRARRTVSKVASPARKFRLGERKTVKFLAKVFRPVRRVLRWLMPRYIVNSWREVRQVIWPNRRETWRLTLAVFIFAIVFGLALATPRAVAAATSITYEPKPGPGKGRHLVFLTGDEEYRSEEGLPMLAKIFSTSSSGSRISQLKNSITARKRFLKEIGNANAA